MSYMKIEDIRVDELKPYENNPRKNDKAVPKVMESIRKFGFKVPLVVDKDNVIVCGHTRYKASLKLKLETVPCIRADDLDEEQIRAFRIWDNKTAEYSEWDDEKLLEEVKGIEQMLEELDLGLGEDVNPYTQKVDAPIYQPMEDEAPPVEELYDTDKTNGLIAEIEKADIPADIKQFLIYSAYRHIVFDYSRIAEFYCHQDKEVQELMEKSALVIIDFDKAIEYGYTTLKGKLEELLEKDKGSE